MKIKTKEGEKKTVQQEKAACQSVAVKDKAEQKTNVPSNSDVYQSSNSVLQKMVKLQRESCGTEVNQTETMVAKRQCPSGTTHSNAYQRCGPNLCCVCHGDTCK